MASEKAVESKILDIFSVQRPATNKGRLERLTAIVNSEELGIYDINTGSPTRIT